MGNEEAAFAWLAYGFPTWSTYRINIEAILTSSPRQLARQFRHELGIGNEPLDVIAAATQLGCVVSAPKQISKTRTVEADLTPYQTRDRFRVRVDPTPRNGWTGASEALQARIARHRFRFRVCHELGHTYFFDRRSGSGPRRAHTWTASEERWCDEFAQALLVPSEAIKQLPLTADTPFDLQAQFDVSLEVAARAVAATHGKLNVALWFWPAGANVSTTSLLRQWASVTVSSLRSWREAKLVAHALESGSVTGSLPSLGRARKKRLNASVNCDHSRRQVIVVAHG